jgi:hypothetical protein
MIWADYGKSEERSTREKNRKLELGLSGWRKRTVTPKSYDIADIVIFALLLPSWMLARVGSFNEAQFRTAV